MSQSSLKRSHNGDNTKDTSDSFNDNDYPSNSSLSDGFRRLSVFGEHKRAVSSVKFAPSRLTKHRGTRGNALVASASASSIIKLWDLAGHLDDYNDNDNEEDEKEQKDEKDIHEKTRKKKQPNAERKALLPFATLSGHSRGINEIAWNLMSPLLASASDDKTVRLWDAVTGDSLVECKGHDNFVFCVDQHHAMVVSGSFDETVKLWDIRSGDCVCTLPAHSDPVTAVSFNRDGTCVCSASHDGLIRIWDVATGECLKTLFAAGNPPVSACRYSPNGKYLLAATLGDSTIRLWPVNRTGSHQCAKTYHCTNGYLQEKEEHPSSSLSKSSQPPSSSVHVNTKYSIACDFMHNGNIVTGSETGHVVIYDLQSRKVQAAWRHSAGTGTTTLPAGEETSLDPRLQSKQQQQQQQYSPPGSPNGGTGGQPAEDIVLAVSAHDSLPLLCSGGMADRRVEFWVPVTTTNSGGAEPAKRLSPMGLHKRAKNAE